MTSNKEWRERKRQHIKEYDEKWKRENPDRFKAIKTAHMDKKRALIRAAKDRPCQRCGESYPYYVMEFHHREPEKKSRRGRGNMSSIPFSLLAEEIAKCDVYCANCHRVMEQKESGKIE